MKSAGTRKKQAGNISAPKRGELSIFSFTERGYALSKSISKLSKNSKLFGPKEVKKGGLKKEVKRVFDKGKSEGIVFIGATGIAVRSIAPFIRDKTTDPAVIVIDERARFVISLLSGHLGGANELTKLIAKKLKAREVITTATDLAGLPCVEDIALKFSLQIETKEMIKKVNAAILRGEQVSVIDSNTARRQRMKCDKKLKKAFLFKSRAAKRPKGPVVIITCEEAAKAYKRWKNVFYLRPLELVVGIGCRRGVSIKEVRDAYDSVLTKANISPLSIRNLSSIDIKADEKGLIGFAKKVGLEVDFISAGRIKKIRPPSGISKNVKRLVGVPGVAEPSALISAGTKKEKGKIWVKKQKFKRVTIAVTRVPYTS